MKSYFGKIVESTTHAFRGLGYAYQSDRSFRMEVGGALIIFVYASLLCFLRPLSFDEGLFLASGYVFVLVTELINTAFETAFAKLHPAHDDLVGRSKDIASGAVLVAFTYLASVAAVLLILRLI